MHDLSQAERRTIIYLRGLMEANGRMIGAVVYPDRSERSHAIMGNRIARNLARRGLVLYLRELNAWRLSAAGREVGKK